jgi:hypothetical protein
MPGSSDEVAQKAAARRQRLERRAVELRQRIDRDAESATQAVRRDLSTHWGSDTKAAQHPNVLLAGSLVAGVTLGAVTGGGGDNGGSDNHSNNGRKNRRAQGMLGALLMPVQAQAAGLAREAAEDLFSETRKAIKSGFSDAKPAQDQHPQNGSRWPAWHDAEAR